MKYEFEILDADLEDRKKIILMKEQLRNWIDALSEFGQNTMFDSINRLRTNLEWCENEWLNCQREKSLNRLSEILNTDRSSLNETHWSEDD